MAAHLRGDPYPRPITGRLRAESFQDLDFFPYGERRESTRDRISSGVVIPFILAVLQAGYIAINHLFHNLTCFHFCRAGERSSNETSKCASIRTDKILCTTPVAHITKVIVD